MSNAVSNDDSSDASPLPDGSEEPPDAPPSANLQSAVGSLDAELSARQASAAEPGDEAVHDD